MRTRLWTWIGATFLSAAIGATYVLASPAEACEGASRVQVEVQSSGFVPNEVKVPAKRVSHVRFIRKTDRTCAKEVLFPQLGIEKKLPLNEPVDVTIPAGKARTLSFACGMNMLKGKVIVK